MNALIYALWEKNLDVLQHYLRNKRRLVIVPQALASESLRRAVREVDCELHILAQEESSPHGASVTPLLENLMEGPSSIGLPDDGASRELLEVIAQQVSHDFPALHARLGVLDALAEQHDIEITVVNEDVTREGKTLALWSRAKCIPVLHLAHGTGLSRDYSSDAVESDHVAVPGKRSLQYFEDLGVPTERIHIVGNPHWDRLPALAADRTANRAKLAHCYALPPEAFWIVWGSTWNASLSLLDDRNFSEQAVQACVALAALRQSSPGDALLIFKDRPESQGPGSMGAAAGDLLMAVAAANGVAEHVRYVVDDARPWAACADVVVSYNSNFSIEAVLADTPAVNLTTDFGAITGGGFGADEGVLVVEFRELPGTLERLWRDPAYRRSVVASAARLKEFYNAGIDRKSVARTAELIWRCARKTTGPTQKQRWRAHQVAGLGSAPTTFNAPRWTDLVNLLPAAPAVALAIGPTAAAAGTLLARRFPVCRIDCIETTAVPTDAEFDALGIPKGGLEVVLLADLLERTADPWAVLERVRPYLSATGTIGTTLFNLRNVLVLDELSRGNWSYGASGVLDINHVRFFTRSEILRCCHECGYRATEVRHVIDTRLQDLWESGQQAAALSKIETDRLTFKNVPRDEVLELCAVAYLVLIGKDPDHTEA